MTITVNTKFDAGSIVVKDISNHKHMRFGIRNDTQSRFAQWFYFQLNNVRQRELKITFEGLDKTAYPDGWDGYNICASYDNVNWFRIPCEFKANTLTFAITPWASSIYFAYFAPYSYARHLELVGMANLNPLITHEVLGTTIEGRTIDLLVAGKPTADNKIWVIARQHPGETMAQWFMEGFIYRLLDGNDALSNTLLQNCIFYLVPNMNPDGAYHGNLRTNTAGINLNREWLTPSLEKSPEVYHVRQKMLATGVSMFFDIHGDEAIPYVFTAGCGDNPGFSTNQQQLEQQFQTIYQRINPDYQTRYGYERGHFTAETPTLATNWVGEQFDCLALTLEMPFKDNANLPDSKYGWSKERSHLLGRDMLTVINFLIDEKA